MEAGVRRMVAAESLRIRALRTHFFPHDIFAEYAWVLLLAAYRHQSGDDEEHALDAMPPLDGKVMQYWRRYLEEEGLIVPAADEKAVPTLTANGMDRMERYLDELARRASDLT